MSRRYRGFSPTAIEDPVIREVLSEIDLWIRDADPAIGKNSQAVVNTAGTSQPASGGGSDVPAGTYSRGDLPVGVGPPTNGLTRLPVGSAGNVLVSSGLDPIWTSLNPNTIGAKMNADVLAVGGAMTLLPDLSFQLSATGSYWFRYVLVFNSDTLTSGARFSMSGPTNTTFAATATAVFAADGAAATWTGAMTLVGDVVATTDVPEVGVDYIATVEGIIVPDTDGTLTPRGGREGVGATVTFRAGSVGVLSRFA